MECPVGPTRPQEAFPLKFHCIWSRYASEFWFSNGSSQLYQRVDVIACQKLLLTKIGNMPGWCLPCTRNWKQSLLDVAIDLFSTARCSSGSSPLVSSYVFCHYSLSLQLHNSRTTCRYSLPPQQSEQLDTYYHHSLSPRLSAQLDAYSSSTKFITLRGVGYEPVWPTTTTASTSTKVTNPTGPILLGSELDHQRYKGWSGCFLWLRCGLGALGCSYWY